MLIVMEHSRADILCTIKMALLFISLTIDDLFIKYGYKQFIISQDLLHLKNKLKNAYNLDYYKENRIEGTLLFGLYNNIDLQILEKMNRKEKVGILWGGSDIMLNSKLRNKVLKIII